ncbi:hypothetical protein [Flavobacterium sp.]|uniref:hypothetical protein n=1 Tax=Flavobacterium sp. TaxID=239 RepID=UPI0026120268|nr:hypothetical protein [Flavobacterium sp.]
MNEILNFTEESILKAAEIVDQNPNLRKGRESIEYDLVLNNKKYPPILILSEANKILGGKELLLTDFNNSTKKAFKIFDDFNLRVARKMFTWLPLYKEMANWVLQYQNQQLQLIDILKEIGFNKNLEDEDNTGKIPLTEIDPFTFFAFFQKLKNPVVRAEHLKKLKKIVDLKSEMPLDFNGLPSAQPMSVWFFTFKKYRDPKAISNLWELSKQALEGKLSAELFNSTIQLRGIKIAKLSQGLFWLNSECFYPIDIHKNFLEARGINTEIETLDDYLKVLEEIKTKFNQPFYEISYNAWKNNQDDSENVINELQENLPNIWIEKTIVKDRPDREVGERALGKALWSPQKDKGGADIYKNMRLVNIGDIVLHLIDNQKISGISRVKKSVIETSGLPGTPWDGPCYLVELEQYTELNPELDRTDFLTKENKDFLDKIAEESEVFYNNKLDLRQGAYLTPCPFELFQYLDKKYKDYSSRDLPFFEEFDFKEELNEKKPNNLNTITMKHLSHFMSIKTKPFVILAGLSGTGKSRLARTFA